MYSVSSRSSSNPWEGIIKPSQISIALCKALTNSLVMRSNLQLWMHIAIDC